MTYSTGADRVIAATEADTVYRKIFWRIMPILFISYCIAFLDRVNVGFVKLEMGQSIGMDPAQFGFAAGIFFISYALLELPSNMLFERLGARKTFLRIMLLWGIVVVLTAFVQTPVQFYIMRLLLGVFEAGFFPGMILYLSYWFPSERRARATATVFLANALASTIVGPLSGAIMTWGNGIGGMEGWRWVFVIEGIPACIMGLVCFFCLADRLETASWLSPRERAIVAADLGADQAAPRVSAHGRGAVLSVLSDPRIYLLSFIYFCATCANYLFNFWLPTLIQDGGVSKIMNIGLLNAIPMLAGILGLLVMNFSSDYLRDRRWHLAVAFLLASVGLFFSAQTGNFAASLALLCLANFGVTAIGPLFWTLPPTYLDAQRAPAGIAVISMLGIFAGFVSPMIFGQIKEHTGSLNAGLDLIAAAMLFCVVLVLFVIPKAALRVGRDR